MSGLRTSCCGHGSGRGISAAIVGTVRKDDAGPADDPPMSFATPPPTRRAPRALPAPVLLAVALVLSALPVLVPAPARAAVPAPRTVPEAIDAYAGYEGQTLCTPSTKPGTAKLVRLLLTTYGSAGIGVGRSCSSGGTSEHKEGRAIDWMVSHRVPAQRAKAEAFLHWLLAPGADGQPAEMARRLGVMYIGWNNHFWASYRAADGWTDLKGCTTDPAKKASGYDTYCHRNHVHLSLSWDGAAGLTSYWSGSAIEPACSAPWGAASTTAGPAGDLVPVAAVRVHGTRGGTGLDSPCRLEAEPSWDTTRGDAVVRVTGVGDVPAEGVGAVAVRVNVGRTSAPGPTVSLRSTASSPSIPVVTSPTSLSYGSTTVLPVASDGTIRVGLDRGGADVSLDVVGWAPVVPAAPPVTGPSATVTSGTTHAVAAAVVYSGADPLAPRETRTVHLAGLGGLPASGVTGVAVTLTVAPTARPGLVGVVTDTGRAFLGSLRSSTTAPRSTQVIVPGSGDVVLRNLGAAPAQVTLRLDGWFDATPTPGAALTLLDTPATVIDTARHVGLPTGVLHATSRVVTMTGDVVPAGATGLLLAVDVHGGRTEGTLSLGSVRWMPAVSFGAREWAHETVLIALRGNGRMALGTASIGSHFRVTVLGYTS